MKLELSIHKLNIICKEQFLQLKVWLKFVTILTALLITWLVKQ